MKLQPLVDYCRALPHIIEDVKWGNDLVFSIEGGKMFCVFSFEENRYMGMSFKVDDHRFLEMTDRAQFIPAPYMARARWVSLIDEQGIAQAELESLIQRSYQLYFEKLPQRTQREYLSQRF